MNEMRRSLISPLLKLSPNINSPLKLLTVCISISLYKYFYVYVFVCIELMKLKWIMDCFYFLGSIFLFVFWVFFFYVVLIIHSVELVCVMKLSGFFYFLRGYMYFCLIELVEMFFKDVFLINVQMLCN